MAHRLIRSLLFVLHGLALFAACQSEDQPIGTGGASGASGASSGGAGATGGTDAGGAPAGPCAGQTCTTAEFCDYHYDWCEKTPCTEPDWNATCAPRSKACEEGLPACGCNGKVYPDACAAYQAGVDVRTAPYAKQSCPPALTPSNRFPCGPWYCPALSYCLYSVGDCGIHKAECVDLPPGCNGVGDCSCVPSFEHCTTVEGNGVSGVVVFYNMM